MSRRVSNLLSRSISKLFSAGILHWSIFRWRVCRRKQRVLAHLDVPHRKCCSLPSARRKSLQPALDRRAVYPTLMATQMHSSLTHLNQKLGLSATAGTNKLDHVPGSKKHCLIQEGNAGANRINYNASKQIEGRLVGLQEGGVLGHRSDMADQQMGYWLIPAEHIFQVTVIPWSPQDYQQPFKASLRCLLR